MAEPTDPRDPAMARGASDIREEKPPFPFAAIVDQERAKEALLMAVINPAVNGVLFLGEKGTGKTTLVRSLSTLLPETRVIELPLGSSEEMVLGTVDAEKALATGKVNVKPGILARADGHLLYIDEVNLLPDHLVDVILDAAATGRYRLERDGLSMSYDARFVLVGSMNPEEGWLRPQLLDRFGLAVHISAISEVDERAEVFRRTRAFAADPKGFLRSYGDDQAEVRERLLLAQSRLKDVTVPENVVQRTIEAVLRLGVKTHRAELATLQGALARAALYERDQVLWEDVQRVLPLALQHRLSDSDTQKPVTWDRLDRRLEESGKGSEKDKDKGWFPSPFFRKKKETH